MLTFLVNLINKFSNSNRSLVIAITKMTLVNESLCCYIYSHILFMLPWASAQCWGGSWKYLAGINCLLLHLLGCLRNLQWLSGDMFVCDVRSSHSVLSIMDLFTCLFWQRSPSHRKKRSQRQHTQACRLQEETLPFITGQGLFMPEGNQAHSHLWALQFLAFSAYHRGW